MQIQPESCLMRCGENQKNKMHKIIKTLNKLARKKEKVNLNKKLNIIIKQLRLISEIEKEENSENHIINSLINKIKLLETQEEFNISKRKAKKIIREKFVEEKLRTTFSHEIIEIRRRLGDITHTLIEQKNDIENKKYQNIRNSIIQ